MGPSGFIRNKLLVGMVACGTIAGLAAVAGPVAAQAATGRHTLPGSTPRWLHSAHKLGATPSAQRVSFGIVLSMRDQAGAASQLKAISEPGSAQYGDWLSNKAFDAKYAPAKASVSAVRGWLRAAGLRRDQDAAAAACTSRRPARPTQVEQTFGTSLHHYKYNGKTRALERDGAVACRPARRPRCSTRSPASSASTRAPRSSSPPTRCPDRRRAPATACSPARSYYGQKTATDPSRGLRHASALRGLRLRAAAVPARPTASPAC